MGILKYILPPSVITSLQTYFASVFVAKNYKEYMAVISQTNAAPTVDYTVINDFDSVAYAKVVDGSFTLTLTGAGESATSFISISQGNGVGTSVLGAYYSTGDAVFAIKSRLVSSGALGDGLIVQASVYIRIYN